MQIVRKHTRICLKWTENTWRWSKTYTYCIHVRNKFSCFVSLSDWNCTNQMPHLLAIRSSWCPSLFNIVLIQNKFNVYLEMRKAKWFDLDKLAICVCVRLRACKLCIPFASTKIKVKIQVHLVLRWHLHAQFAHAHVHIY